MYDAIIDGPPKWDIVIAANNLGEHGRRKIVTFAFLDTKKGAKVNRRMQVRLSGERRVGDMSILLSPIDRMDLHDSGDEISHDTVYSYLYDPDNRRGTYLGMGVLSLRS